MLKSIYRAIKGFINTVMMIVDFIITLIEDIIYVIKLTAEALAEIPSYFTWLPDFFVPALITLFGIVIVYKVIGREG